MFKKLKIWKDQKDTFKELSRLSDRELIDIGINRSQIRNIAKRQTFY